MSTRLPLQSRSIRPKFQNKKNLFGDDDEENTEQDERIVGLEDNKIEELIPKEKKEPLKIAPLANTDWRNKKNIYIPETAKQPSIAAVDVQQKEQHFGLQIQTKKTVESVEQAQVTETTTTVIEEVQVQREDEKVQPQTLEERAVEAIIKDAMGVEEEKEEGPKKVIVMDETTAFRNDIEDRPDETTMDDYENVPVEEFGAALLRGLGWNEGEGIGRNRKNEKAPVLTPVKQREALLGLGAKPEDIEKSKKGSHRKSAYQYKDTSLFKKISKQRIEEKSSKDSDRGYSSRDSSISSSSSSKRRRSRSGSRHSSRDSSSHERSYYSNRIKDDHDNRDRSHRDERDDSSSSRKDKEEYYRSRKRDRSDDDEYSSRSHRNRSRSTDRSSHRSGPSSKYSRSK
ncbi:DExH-box splicing factor binding site-domain-containing protein [Pilobolus umbonatus]|nr:DExH-box splicing factor binding site-domain-containing protein [Pilobolus umbonatus]